MRNEDFDVLGFEFFHVLTSFCEFLRVFASFYEFLRVFMSFYEFWQVFARFYEFLIKPQRWKSEFNFCVF